MSLLDLWKLAKRFWWLVIGLPVLFAVFFSMYVFFNTQENTSSYTATGNVVVSTGIKAVAGIAKTETTQIAMAHPDATISCSPDYNLNTITINVKAANREEAAEVLAETANTIVAQAHSLLKGKDLTSDEFVTFNVIADLSDPVAHAERISRSTFLLAPIAGLFTAILIIVIIYLHRRPIMGLDDAGRFANAPVLDSFPLSDGGHRLVVNAGFLCGKGKVNRYCLIPVGSNSAHDLEEAANAIASVMKGSDEARASLILSGQEAMKLINGQSQEGQNAIIVCCDNLQQNVDGACISQESDVTILLVRQWIDSSRSLESTMSELRLAGVSSIGLLYRTK